VARPVAIRRYNNEYYKLSPNVRYDDADLIDEIKNFLSHRGQSEIAKDPALQNAIKNTDLISCVEFHRATMSSKVVCRLS